MKKLLLVPVLLCFISTMSAQEETESPIDKGSFIVDGAVNFGIRKSESIQGDIINETNSFGIGISPKAAYFIIDRLAIGLETSLSFTKSDFTNFEGDEISQNSTGISVGPFARYYLANGFFGQGSVGFGSSKSKSDGNDYTSETFRYGFGVGYAVFLGPQVSLEPILNYTHRKSTNNQTTSESLNSGFNLGAGFTIYL